MAVESTLKSGLCNKSPCNTNNTAIRDYGTERCAGPELFISKCAGVIIQPLFTQVKESSKDSLVSETGNAT